MISVAVAVRGPDQLRLFWRVRRCPEGHVYVMFSAGQTHLRLEGRAYDPHASWHADGRYHWKSYDRVWTRKQRQPLGGFIGGEPMIATGVDQMMGLALPACDATRFDRVIEIGRETLDPTPGRQQLHLDLVADGSHAPEVGLGERLLARWMIEDAQPFLCLTLYEFPPLGELHAGEAR